MPKHDTVVKDKLVSDKLAELYNSAHMQQLHMEKTGQDAAEVMASLRQDSSSDRAQALKQRTQDGQT